MFDQFSIVTALNRALARGDRADAAALALGYIALTDGIDRTDAPNDPVGNYHGASADTLIADALSHAAIVADGNPDLPGYPHAGPSRRLDGRSFPDDPAPN